MREYMILYPLELQLFATAGNTTTSNTSGNDLSPEMKTFYSDVLIDNATPNLVHDQFGQKHPIPKNGGKTIEFRKYSPLAKATTPPVSYTHLDVYKRQTLSSLLVAM